MNLSPLIPNFTNGMEIIVLALRRELYLPAVRGRVHIMVCKAYQIYSVR